MASTIEQQVTLDEALVPIAQRFKMDTRKHIVDLEAFREMLHISPNVSGQSFAELPFEEEILEFLRFLGHSAQIKTLTDVNVNKLFQPWRSFAAVINKCLTGKSFGIDSHRNTKAYKEYYACATGEAAPKPKASARRKRGGSASSTTPPTPIATPTPITTVVAAPRLTAAAKGKQPARATSPTDPSNVEWTETKQLKIVLRRSRQETHISQQGGFSTDEGTGSKLGEEESFDPIPRTPEESKDDGNDEEDQGLSISEEERMQKEEEADELYRDIDINQGRGLQVSQDIDDSHVTLTPIHSDGQESSSTSSFVTILLNLIIDPGMESIFTTGSSSVTSIPSPKSTMTPSIITTTTTASQPPIPPTPIPSDILQTLPTFASVFRFEDRVKLKVKSRQVTRILPRIEESVNAQLEAEVLTRSSHSSRTSYVVAADLSKMELKKILINKMEGNKSIQRSDEQRNLYKRRREGGEHASASTPSELATTSAGRSTTGTQSRQMSASESAFAEEPVQTTCQMEEPSHPVFETGAEDQPIVQTSQHPEWFSQPRKPPTPDHDWNKTLRAVQGSAHEGESDEEETRHEEEESFDPIPRTPEESEEESNDEEDQEIRLSEEARIQEEENADELYRDVNINQGRGLQVTQNVKDTHVTLTPVNPDGPQESSSMSSFVTSMLNPTNDVGVESIFTTASSSITTNPFADAVSAILGIVHQFMTQQMTEAVREAVQIQTDRLQDSLQRENDEFLRNIDENMKKIIKGQVKNQALVEAYEADKAILDTYGDSTILKRRREDDDQEGPSAGLNRGSKRQKEGGEHATASNPSETATEGSGRSTTGSQSRQQSASESAFAEEPVQTTCQMEEPPHSVFETARQTDARSSFNELLDTPIDFSNFIMHWLNVDTLTPDLLAGPTYELMKGSCTSLAELEYHLEEIYKATTYQLDWVNPEGQQYPHNLLQPLPL
nr:hypothetical protein [Tanacetum cinerariifolium]